MQYDRNGEVQMVNHTTSIPEHQGRYQRTYSLQELLFVACIVLVAAVSFIPADAHADPYLGGIPLDTVQEGVVSGGLYIDSYPGFATSATKSFSLPTYSEIQWARLYVIVYCGHMENNYQGQATVDFDGGNGYQTLGTELLNVPYSFPGTQGTGPVTVNGHCNRVTSDYLIWYDVKNSITKPTLSARVSTGKAPGYTGSFDGRIKAITLIVAYNSTGKDEVHYWVNQGHDTDSHYVEQNGLPPYEGETSFATSEITGEWKKSLLSTVYLASENAAYTFNGESLDSGKPQGSYLGSQTSDVTEYLSKGKDSVLIYNNQPDKFYKIFLAGLTVTTQKSEAGSIGVSSSAAGAKIFIDDEDSGTVTNATIPALTPGSHSVRVEKEGYQVPQDRVVKVLADQTATVSFALTPITGNVRVTSVPSGASVALDGTPVTGKTPVVLNAIPTGDHSVKLSLAGYQDYSETVTVAEGETSEVIADLARASQGGSGGTTSAAESTSIGGTVQGETGYVGKPLSPYTKGSVHGDFQIFSTTDYSGLLSPGQSKEYHLPVIVPGNSTPVFSRLYLYSTWSHDESTRTGILSVPLVSINGTELKIDKKYSDQKGNGTYNYPAETFAFDAVKDIIGNGTYTITVKNNGKEHSAFATYGILLLMVTKDPGRPEIAYWINEGSDIVLADPQFGTSTDDAVTTAGFSGPVNLSHVGSARLICVSTAASGGKDDENRITFNDAEWANPLNRGSSEISVADLPALPGLKNDKNSVGIVSYLGVEKGDYMENRNAVLVITLQSEQNPAPSSTGRGNTITPGRTISPSGTQAHKVVQPTKIPGNLVIPARPSSREPGIVQDIRDLIAAAIYPVIWLFDGDSASSHDNAPDQPLLSSVSAVNEKPGGLNVPEILLMDDPTNVESSTDDEENPPAIPANTTKATQVNAPAATTSVVPQPGGLYVDSFPRGATIYIDGKKIDAITPHVITWVKSGIHSIRVKKEGVAFPTDNRRVWVYKNYIVRTLFTSSTTDTRTITINSTSLEGSDFTVNGRFPKYQVPESVDVEGWGSHITFSDGKSYRSVNIPTSINSGETFEVKPQNNHLAGVYISSTPPGADILVDGFPTGLVTPAVVTNVSSGMHLFTVSTAGYLPDEELVTVIDNPTEEIDTRVSFTLTPYSYGSLTISSIPEGARILIYNKDTGEKTPHTFSYLNTGSITAGIDDGNNSRTIDTVIGAGSNQKYSFDFTNV